MGNIIIAISIHALREEGDSACPALVGSAQEFLSTPSARRATKPRRRERSRQNISIHALREEGDRHTPNSEHGLDDFYPRPPRGGRPADGYLFSDQYGFLSTPSARRATDCFAVYVSLCRISIHALREEGDNYAPLLCLLVPYFYPRPPRGGRPTTSGMGVSKTQFLSTPSARRATWSCRDTAQSPTISIHALREEGDVFQRVWHPGLSDFYPRPPRGGRPLCILALQHRVGFLSTPSARRATGSGMSIKIADKFLSTPSARRATRRGAESRNP